MNTKYKTASSSGVPRSVGRPVGVLPLARRPTVPGGQRKFHSTDRRQIKRTPSTGSIGSLSSARSVQSNASSHRKFGSREVDPQEDRDFLDDDDDDGGGGQNIRFINSDAKRASSSLSTRSVSYQDRKTVTTEEILDSCQESDPYKVYEIDLHGADLTIMPDFEKFRKLRVLDISGNHLKNIVNLDFNKDLKELKLYDNSISTIEGLENLKELCSVQLQHNQITTIGRGLGHLKKLSNLRLDCNKLSKIDTPELLSCSALTSLDLSSNGLETLAPLSYLSNLEELNASGNRLKKVGDISKCRRLQEVDLSRNRLTELGGIAGLPNLKILDVSSNQLSSVKTVGKLRSLEELNLNCNRISELSSFPTAFPKLQILFVCDNMIVHWDEICTLSALPDLVELFLSANPVTLEDGEMPTYHHHVTFDLPRLEVIDGVVLKKHNPKSGAAAPVMRPMSAASIISVRQVDAQMKSLNAEQESLQKSISDKFLSLKSQFDKLPSELPKSSTSRPISTASSSRCNSRLKIRAAQQFAAQNFEAEDGWEEGDG